MLVHGDDYAGTGSASSLECFQKELEKAYEIQTQHIGSAEGKPREGKVLNQIIRCTGQGFEIEADPDMLSL